MTETTFNVTIPSSLFKLGLEQDEMNLGWYPR